MAFLHSYRPPTPETYRLMLGCTAAQPRSRSEGRLAGAHEPASKRQKTGDELLKRVRSLVRPLQVESEWYLHVFFSPSGDLKISSFFV